MTIRSTKLAIILIAITACVLLPFASRGQADDDYRFAANDDGLNQTLLEKLQQFGFTGDIESTLEQRLGRRVNNKLADVGQALWFDTVTGLNDDNTCAGCHSPTNGYGAFTRLEDAIRHHLDVFASARSYNPAAQNLDADLTGPTGPIEPVLARVDPILATPILLQEDEFLQLVEFVRNGLLDPRAEPKKLRKLVLSSVPSGRPVLTFQFGR